MMIDANICLANTGAIWATSMGCGTVSVEYMLEILKKRLHKLWGFLKVR